MTSYRQVIATILARPDTSLNVACLKESDDVILGYSITQPNILHFVFVKYTWRDMGIARALVPEDTVFATHITRHGTFTKPPHIRFNPFKL